MNVQNRVAVSEDARNDGNDPCSISLMVVAMLVAACASRVFEQLID